MTLQCALIETRGCGCQVYCWRCVSVWTGLALFLSLIAYQFPCSQVECQRGELGCTRVEIDAVQVVTQDTVGYLSSSKSMELLTVHRDEHIESFAQEVAATHARVEHGKAGEIECC